MDEQNPTSLATLIASDLEDLLTDEPGTFTGLEDPGLRLLNRQNDTAVSGGSQ